MMVPDFINGLFESLGGVMIWQSVRQIRKDKCLRGVHWAPITFFTTWGFWNLFYYPHLGQWLSFVGGLSTVGANVVWLYLIRRYWRS